MKNYISNFFGAIGRELLSLFGEPAEKTAYQNWLEREPNFSEKNVTLEQRPAFNGEQAGRPVSDAARLVARTGYNRKA